MDELLRRINELAAKDWLIRQRAAVIVGDIGDLRAVGPLVYALKDEHKDVRRCAAEALGKIGSAAAVDPLINALGDPDEYVRQCVAVALGDIGDVRANEPLIKTLEDQDEWVRWYATEALGKIGDTRAVDLLVNALRSQSPNVRQKAKEALEKLRHHLEAITKEKAECLLCPICLCRFHKCQAKLGALQDFTYYACRNCHGSQFIDNVAKVTVVLDTILKDPYVHNNTSLLVNWFKHKEPFDFDEVQIEAADDFDVEEFVVKMRNDPDIKRRQLIRTIPVFIMPGVEISQAKRNLLSETFTKVEVMAE